MSGPTLFDRLGGEGAITAALDHMYPKVLADGRISHFSQGVDIENLKVKVNAFLIMAFAGPNNYTGKDLREGHRHLVARGLDDGHFDVFGELLNTTLEELSVPEDLISEVMAAAEGARTEVLNQ